MTAKCESACAQTIQKVQTGGSLDARGPAGKEVRPSANGPLSAARSGSLGGVGVPPPPPHWQKVVEFSNRRLRFLTCSPEQNAEFSQVLCAVTLFTVHWSLSSTLSVEHLRATASVICTVSVCQLESNVNIHPYEVAHFLR